MTANSPDRQAPFVEPAPYGYLYLGLRIDPPSRVPFVAKSAARTAVLRTCKALAQQLNEHAEVVATTVYEAVLIPPAKDSPRFDVMVLIQTTTPDAILAVQATEAYQHLKADFVMTARNLRRIGDTDHGRTGYFLFNHFTSNDPVSALRAFDPIAGWFTHKAGVQDSTLLQPTGDSPYVFVNHVRLPYRPIPFLLRLLKPSFRTSVTQRLAANRMSFAAVVCRTV